MEVDTLQKLRFEISVDFNSTIVFSLFSNITGFLRISVPTTMTQGGREIIGNGHFLPCVFLQCCQHFKAMGGGDDKWQIHNTGRTSVWPGQPLSQGERGSQDPEWL